MLLLVNTSTPCRVHLSLRQMTQSKEVDIADVRTSQRCSSGGKPVDAPEHQT